MTEYFPNDLNPRSRASRGQNARGDRRAPPPRIVDRIAWEAAREVLG